MEEEKWNKFWRSSEVGVSPTRKNLFREFMEIELPKKSKVLDVGCGSGTLAHFWKEQGYNVTGFDISEKSLEISRNKGIYCVKGDITKKLPFDDNTFELVYSDGLLEHFKNPDYVLKEIFRASRKHVLTIVPRNSITTLVHNLILRPPKEYRRKDSEWINLHQKFNPKNVESQKIGFGKLPLPPHLLYILCEL